MASTKVKASKSEDKTDNTANPYSTALSLLEPYLCSDSKAPRDLRILARDESYLSTIKVARSFFTSNKVYNIRVSRVGLIASTAGSIISSAFGVKPSDMTSSTSLQALFDQARLTRTRIHLSSLVGTTSTTSPGPAQGAVLVVFDSNNSSGAPVFSVGAEIPGAKLIPTHLTVPYSQMSRISPRPWSQTAAGSSGSDPVGGILGTWDIISANSSLTASTNYFAYIIECVYQFRNLTA